MDLDERELYSEDEFAAQDSGSEGEASGDEDGLSLGNVELEAAPRMRQPLPGAASAPEPAVEGEIAQPPTWQFSGKRKQRQDGRVLLLFDINGVLMQHRWDGVSHQHDLRPGVHHLLRLVPHFRLGIYSSATRPTVTKALHKLHGNLANFMLQRRAAAAAAGGSGAAAGAASSGGKKKKKKVAAAAAAAAAGVAAGGAVDADGFPLELPKQLFEVVMARDHCVPAAKEDIEARGGRPWDTVKPLHKYFNALARVALVDDSAHKAVPKEGANMLIMPCWHGPAHPLGRGDACLPLLVDELVAWITPHASAAAGGAAGRAAGTDGAAEAAESDAADKGAAEAAAQAAAPAADVRLVTAGISAKLAAAAQQQLEEARAAGQLTQEQAAAALAVVEAAVSGSAAVAAAAAAAAEAGFDATSPERPAAQQQLRKRPAEQDAAAAGDGTAGPAAEGTEEAGAKPLTKRQRLRQMQQQEQQLAAAASMLLLAAAAAAAEASGQADREGGGSGATLAEINSYLNQWQPKVTAALLNKTAKRALSDAVKAGLVELVPEDASAPAAVPAAAAEAAAPAAAGSSAAAEAAANGAATHSAAGSRYAGRRHRLTSAGAAAVPTKQHLLELAAQCCGASAIAGVGSEAAAAPAAPAPAADAPGAAGLEGKVSGKGKKKRRRGGAGAADGAAEQAQQEGQQAQQAQQAQHAAGGDTDMLDVDAGFFWQKQQQPEPQAEQPAQQQPAPQQGQERQMPAQQQGEEQQADGEGAAAAEAAPETGTGASQPLSMAATRAAVQQGLLLVALAKLQQRRGASSAKLDGWVHQLLAEQHPHLPLRDASAPKRQKAAARSLRAMLQKGMDACEQNGWLVASRSEPGLPAALVLWSIGLSAPPAASEAEVAAAAAALAAAIARAPGVALPAAQPAAAASGAAAVAAAAAAAPVPAAEPAAAGVHAAAPEAAAAAGVQAEGEAAMPLLLDVFEDKGGPPPAAAGAAAGAAAARAAAAAEPAPLAVFEDRAPAPLAGQHAQQPPLEQHVQQAHQQRPQQAQRVQLPGDQEGPRFGPSMTVEQLKAEHKRYLKAVIGQLGAKGSRLPPHQKPVYKQLKKQADRRLKAEVARRGRTGKQAAADVLDRLFEVASGGSDEAWAAAVGQLSEAERAALASQGVDLEQYRQGLAARALGGDAGGLGSEREGGGGKEEEEEEGEESLSGSEEEADYEEEESEWSTASEGEEEEAAAGPSAARQQPSFFWERAQHAQRAQRTQQGFSPLHFEVEAFAQRATPTQQEAEAVQSAVLAVDAAARELWPHSRVALFGSQATGLALPGSDLDIVVLGVGATLTRAGTGFSKVQRKQLSELLEDLLDALLKRKLLSGKAQIIEARVPIIKCKLQFGGGLAADISLGAENGAHAVDFVRRQVLAVPPLRPLCLAVKAFLRERGQNEVFTGGLSSYSLFNMVMAHLQCEGFTPDLSAQQAQQAQSAQQGGRGWRPPPSRPADLQQTLAFLQQLAAGALPAMSEAATAAHAAAAQRAHVHFGDEGEEDAAPGQQQPQADLGVLLWGFFDRFGNRFSYAKQAVSIRLGGVCTKLKAWRQARKPWLLAVEDPQEMGKDVGSGSFGVRDIKEAFAEAAELLAEVCEDLDANEAAVAGATPTAAGAAAAAAAAAGEPGTSAAAAAAVGQQQEQRQGGGGRPCQTLLAGVLDVEAAVGRSAAALRARQAMEKRAAAKSQKVLHERIRSGVMLRRQPTAKQQARQQKLARKAERKARIKQDNEEYQERQQGKRERLKGKRQGSRRGAAVEAQWGSTRGQYKDFSDEEWSLRKQKKAKKNKGQQQQQQQQQQQGGGAQSNSGGGGSAKKQKLQRKQQQKQRLQQWCQQQRQKQKGKKRQSQGGGQGSGDGGGSASKKARRN